MYSAYFQNDKSHLGVIEQAELCSLKSICDQIFITYLLKQASSVQRADFIYLFFLKT